MEHEFVIRCLDIADVFYRLFDETDISHCPLIGDYLTEEAVLAAKHYSSLYPNSVVRLYKMTKLPIKWSFF